VTGTRVRVVFSMEGIDPQLVHAVREGTYVVDPRAVAEAIIRRERQQLADVFEALELSDAPVIADEDEPGARPDAA
jgi:hypothetical protein